MTLKSKLIDAAKSGHIQTIKDYIQAKGNVNDVSDENGWSLLHYATKSHRNEIVELLLKNGADINLPSKDFIRPLHIAAKNKNKEAMTLFLLDNKVKIDIKDDHLKTPLHYAVSEGYLDGVKLLIAAKVDVNARESDGYTPLHLVICTSNLNERVAIARLLIEEGNADIEVEIVTNTFYPAETGRIYSLLHYAMYYKRQPIVELIERKLHQERQGHNLVTSMLALQEKMETLEKTIKVLTEKMASAGIINDSTALKEENKQSEKFTFFSSKS